MLVDVVEIIFVELSMEEIVLVSLEVHGGITNGGAVIKLEDLAKMLVIFQEAEQLAALLCRGPIHPIEHPMGEFMEDIGQPPGEKSFLAQEHLAVLWITL